MNFLKMVIADQLIVITDKKGPFYAALSTYRSCAGQYLQADTIELIIELIPCSDVW